MELKLEASAPQLDIFAESRFCIAEGLKNQESVKRSSKLSRLNISDSLDLVKREKYLKYQTKNIRNVYTNTRQGYSKAMYNHAQSDQTGMVQLNRRYSMPREYHPLPPPPDENVYQQLSQHLRTRKLNRSNIQGQGMDAFWTFRKHKAEEAVREKRRAKKNGANSPLLGNLSVNPVESAYLSIMAWAKLPQDTSIAFSNLRRFVASWSPQELHHCSYNERTIQCAFSPYGLPKVEFFQFKSFTNYKDFTTFSEYLHGIGLRLSSLISFLLYDLNDDGYVCQGDVFKLFEGELSKKIEPDLMRIGSFIKSEPKVDVDQLEERFKIETLILKDTLLTIKDYEMYFKKVEEPYMKAKNKKDTIFAKSFIVLDHREKVRSTRKEMEIKKTMYNELIGEILGVRTKDVLLRLDRFRLDFGTFFMAFEGQRTHFYRHFCETVFGVAF